MVRRWRGAVGIGQAVTCQSAGPVRPDRPGFLVPELPDITVYIEALSSRIVGHTLERIRLASPFLLRSVSPPLSAVEGAVVSGLRRLGKRIVFEFADSTFLVLHLMIAGRLKWKPLAP